MKTFRRISIGQPPGALLLLLTLAITVLLSHACTATDCILEQVPADSCSGRNTATVLILSPADASLTTRAESWWLITRTDAFVFDDDGLRRLDSYNRSFAYSTSGMKIMSGDGEKLVTVVANAALSDTQIAGISSHDDLEKLCVELVSDSPNAPVMIGEGVFSARKDQYCPVQLSPIMSVIEIHSLRCSLQGQYAGKHLSKVKAYLTDVSNRCELLRNDGFIPVEYLNTGGLREEDMVRLSHPDMLYRYLGDGRKGSDGSYSYGEASLYCYPDECSEESIGSAFTRLVIEGEIDGQIWKYSIPVNRVGYGFGSGTQGVGRNCRYVYDIVINSPPQSENFP